MRVKFISSRRNLSRCHLSVSVKSGPWQNNSVHRMTLRSNGDSDWDFLLVRFWISRESDLLNRQDLGPTRLRPSKRSQKTRPLIYESWNALENLSKQRDSFTNFLTPSWRSSWCQVPLSYNSNFSPRTETEFRVGVVTEPWDRVFWVREEDSPRITSIGRRKKGEENKMDPTTREERVCSRIRLSFYIGLEFFPHH